MKPPFALAAAFLATALPLAAAAPADAPSPADGRLLAEPLSPSRPAADQPNPTLQGCDAKGCPEKDQFGQAPTSCTYKSGMSTGFRCVLICTYPKSQWGTFLAASNCN